MVGVREGLPENVIAMPGAKASEPLIDEEIARSTEFVCERWGKGGASVAFYAPVTRSGGVVWLHATCAREVPWEEITQRATRIWGVRGSLWNPREFKLLYARHTGEAPALAKAA